MPNSPDSALSASIDQRSLETAAAETSFSETIVMAMAAEDPEAPTSKPVKGNDESALETSGSSPAGDTQSTVTDEADSTVSDAEPAASGEKQTASEEPGREPGTDSRTESATGSEAESNTDSSDPETGNTASTAEVEPETEDSLDQPSEPAEAVDETENREEASPEDPETDDAAAESVSEAEVTGENTAEQSNQPETRDDSECDALAVTTLDGDGVTDKIKHIVEAALLAAGKPLSIDRLLTLFLDDEQPDRKQVKEALLQLQQEYDGRGIEVREVSTGWRIQVRKEYASWVSRLWEEKPGRYSRALLETLSLIAYRQPITRGEIEDVRGVAVSTNIVKTLLEREWVRVVGHRDVPGRPSLYATTREFLDYFGLKGLDELPTLAELKEIDDLIPSLDLADPEQKEKQAAGDSSEPEVPDSDLAENADTEKDIPASEKQTEEALTSEASDSSSENIDETDPEADADSSETAGNESLKSEA